MTGSSGNENARDIERRAAEWVARLDLSGTAEERAALDAWLSASSRHHAAFARLWAAWERTDNLKNLRPLDGKVDPDLLLFGDEAGLPRPRCTWCRLVLICALVVVLALFALAAFLQPPGD